MDLSRTHINFFLLLLVVHGIGNICAIGMYIQTIYSELMCSLSLNGISIGICRIFWIFSANMSSTINIINPTLIARKL
ncbi:MAG: hypothetical protein WHV60_10055 [Bacteroidota bacterium]